MENKEMSYIAYFKYNVYPVKRMLNYTRSWYICEVWLLSINLQLMGNVCDEMSQFYCLDVDKYGCFEGTKRWGMNGLLNSMPGTIQYLMYRDRVCCQWHVKM